MAGKRLPIEVVEARGNKHLTKSETAQRREQEVRAEEPKQIRSPEYLPQNLKKDFLAIGNQLKALGIFSRLDYDTLARYLIARQFWNQASGEAAAAMESGDLDAMAGWTSIQHKYFQQCRACANDLGMTISSRCQLVVPKAEPREENPFETLLKNRRRA